MKKELIIDKAKQLYNKPQARSLLLNVLALVVVSLIGAPHYEYDMDVMMQAIMDAYWLAKEKNKKYTPKKYRSKDAQK